MQIIETHIDVVFIRYKGKKIGEILADYRIQKSDITQNLKELLEKYISHPQIQDHIHKRILLRLEGFYNSDQAKKILG